jgi:hypothetical protein
MTRQTLQAHLPELVTPPGNMEFSPPERPLVDDCGSARWAVYRGSSAVLTAISTGAEPVYLGNEPEALRIDVLRGRTGFGRVFASIAELAGAIRPELFSPEQRRAAIAYAQNYYTPLNPEVLLRILRAAASGQTKPYQ